MLERETIYQRVWGYAMAHGDRSVDVFVRKLRQKLAKRSPSWEYIHTHFGVGYRFDPANPHGATETPRARSTRRACGEAPAAARVLVASHLIHRPFTGTVTRLRPRRGNPPRVWKIDRERLLSLRAA